MFSSLLQVAAAASLVQTALGRVALRSTPEFEQDTELACHIDWSDVAALNPATVDGKSYGCKCYPGDSCWPSASKWDSLNATVGGALSINIPPAAECHNTFEGPFGTVNTYDAAKCAEATQNWANETWT